MLISNDFFSLTKGLFIYRAYCQYREYIKNNLSKHQIKDLTDFKPLVKRIRNNIILLITVVEINLNELKAYIVVTVKLTDELNMLLIIL